MASRKRKDTCSLADFHECNGDLTAATPALVDKARDRAGRKQIKTNHPALCKSARNTFIDIWARNIKKKKQSTTGKLCHCWNCNAKKHLKVLSEQDIIEINRHRSAESILTPNVFGCVKGRGCRANASVYESASSGSLASSSSSSSSSSSLSSSASSSSPSSSALPGTDEDYAFFSSDEEKEPLSDLEDFPDYHSGNDSDDPQQCCIYACSNPGYEQLSGCTCRPERWMCRGCFGQLQQNNCPYCKSDIPDFDGFPVPVRDVEDQILDDSKPNQQSATAPSLMSLSAGALLAFITLLVTSWQASDPNPVYDDGQVKFWNFSVCKHVTLPESDYLQLSAFNNIIKRHLSDLSEVPNRRFEDFIGGLSSGSLDGLIGSGARARSKGELVRETHDLQNANFELRAAMEMDEVSAENTIARLRMELKLKKMELKAKDAQLKSQAEQLKRTRRSLAETTTEEGKRRITIEYLKARIFGPSSLPACHTNMPPRIVSVSHSFFVHLLAANGRHYQHSFKVGMVEASKSAKSLRATPRMFKAVLGALLGDPPPPFPIFARSSMKVWRDVVAHYRTTAWVDSLRHDSFFLMADGSERKSKNILGIYVVGFCKTEWRHVAVNLSFL
jgi:hypothetical protein